MQAMSRRWPLLRTALVTSAAVAVCVAVLVVASAHSRAPTASSLVEFTRMWADDDQAGYDEDEEHEPVVRDSVVGHAQRQLNILRGHLSRQAVLALNLQRSYCSETF